MTTVYVIGGVLVLLALLVLCFTLRRFIATILYILNTPKVIDEFINGKNKH